MDNKEFLEKLKFGIGDGNLNYYLYNWKCPEMTSEQVSIYSFQVVCEKNWQEKPSCFLNRFLSATQKYSVVTVSKVSSLIVQLSLRSLLKSYCCDFNY